MRTKSGKVDLAEPQAINAGDIPHVCREDIERLFKEHNEALLSFINARLHSWTEAKDVAQEAYVKLLGLDEVRAVSYLKAYLYKIAANLVTDRIRKREVRDRKEHFMFFDARDAAREIPSAETESIEHEEQKHLEQAVARLPARCRLVFTLVEFEGQSVESVAEHLGIKPASVRQFVHRAYEYLAQDTAERFASARGLQ